MFLPPEFATDGRKQEFRQLHHAADALRLLQEPVKPLEPELLEKLRRALDIAGEHVQTAAETDTIVDAIAADVASSQPVKEGAEVRCPGMGEHRSRKENLELGIPVAEEKWNEVLAM